MTESIDDAKCRICNNHYLTKVLDLGEMPISGKFGLVNEKIRSLPLCLSECKNCGLFQLFHKLPIIDLYTSDYGYESHLNEAMVAHLNQVAINCVEQYKSLRKSTPKIIMDIASNDGTLLRKFSEIENFSKLIGIDPLIDNFVNNYPEKVMKIKEFFSGTLSNEIKFDKISIITSLSVFYDLNDPLDFARTVWNILEDEGIWHLEQSYLFSMLANNSFDTICHEHLLYLSAKNLSDIFKKVGFKVISAKLNDVNGGSISISVIKSHNGTDSQDFLEIIDSERILQTDRAIINQFVNNLVILKSEMHQKINFYKNLGFSIVALGASTKGNILLNYLGLDFKLIEKIGEINPKKLGKVTPGTNIPIVAENLILDTSNRNQLIIILPWHFRKTFIEKTKHRVNLGDVVIFPLPNIEVLSSKLIQ